MRGDILTVAEDIQPGTPLLQPCMRQGKRLHPPEPLDRIRQRAAAELERLPEALRALHDMPVYPVEIAAALQHLAGEVDSRQA